MKILSLILRHKPELIGITLEKEGWANVDDLIKGLNKRIEFIENPISIEELEIIVLTNNKKRFEFNGDRTKIRACQGHSINVELEKDWKIFIPWNEKYLFHGTSQKALESILEQGIKPQNRTHVHLSQNKEIAIEVGKRHSQKVVLLKINVVEMQKDHYEFFQASNGVILIKEIPTKYISI